MTDDRARLAHLIGFGPARLSGGPMALAAELFVEAAALAERLGDREALQNAMFGLGDTYRQLGDGAAALAGADRLRERARTSGDLLTEARSWNARSIALLVLGRWEDAIEAGDGAVRAYRNAGSKEAVTYASTPRASP